MGINKIINYSIAKLFIITLNFRIGYIQRSQLEPSDRF